MSDEERVRQAIDQCWREGDLTYLMHDGQLELHALIRKSQGAVSPDDDRPASRKFVLNVSRRWGKSVLLFLMACEDGLTIPNGIIRYCADTEDQVTDFLLPLSDMLLEDCPADLRPIWNGTKAEFRFPSTGAILKLSGMHTRKACNRQRGTGMHRGYVDEAAFTDHLDYMVGSVLMPQCLTTNGTIVISSTPPETPVHPFRAYCLQAQMAGVYFKRTIYDAPHITEALIEEFKAECGGEETSTWRREYLCEFVIDTASAIVPEFEAAKDEIVQSSIIPPYRDCYVVADGGFVDLAFWGFAYYDFHQARIVIEDELVMNNSSVTALVRAATAKEAELWDTKAPQARWGDFDATVIAEMQRERKYAIGTVDNSNRDAAVNGLRLAIQRRKIQIDPRCKNLVTHMEAGIWNTNRTDFQRLNGFGHFDGVAMLMYMERHVPKNRNPYPDFADGVTALTHHLPARQATSSHEAKAFRGLGSKWRKPRA